MPSMNEIYESHAAKYDELVNREDYQGNLKAFLQWKFDFRRKNVVEFGVGTGRLTSLYIDEAEHAFCYDRSCHMLDTAADRLAPWVQRVSLGKRSNLDGALAGLKADMVIEGWSFGHTVAEGPEPIDGTVADLMQVCRNAVLPGGRIILIETLGSNVPEPKAPGPRLARFYELLEQKYGFSRKVLHTDYRFDTVDQAGEIFGYFFGDAMGEAVRRSGSPVVPEFTGVWYL